MKLLDGIIWDRVNYSFYDSLYQTEQFETIFKVIGAFWEFDPLYKDFKSSLTSDNSQTKPNIGWIDRNKWLQVLVLRISGVICYVF